MLTKDTEQNLKTMHRAKTRAKKDKIRCCQLRWKNKIKPVAHKCALKKSAFGFLGVLASWRENIDFGCLVLFKLERAIIHINVADFAVAVERVVDSRLHGRPVIIAPEGAARASVYDMSEEAYQVGVGKDMPLRRALRRCPDAVILPPHPDRYERAMTRLLRCALPFSPLIEATDHKGHLFIDATGTSRLFGPPRDVAWRIRRAVKTDLGIQPVWSVAPNKLVAKVASRTVKPTGESIVRPGDETTFLSPLPVFLIPGIEPEDIERLRELNLLLAGQVSQLDLAQLDVLFGNRNRCVYRAVRGTDPSPVLPVGQAPPAVKKNHAFGNDTNNVARINATLYTLVEQAGADLRSQNLAAGRIRIALDYSDGIRLFRQQRVKPATANDRRLFASARNVLELAWVRRVRLRHLRLVCDRLTFPPAQQPLFAEDQKRERIDEGVVGALDAIRGRFGKEAIKVGRTMVENTKTRSMSRAKTQRRKEGRNQILSASLKRKNQKLFRVVAR